MGKDYMIKGKIMGEDYSLIDELVKMYILKVFVTGDICRFGLDQLTEDS